MQLEGRTSQKRGEGKIKYIMFQVKIGEISRDIPVVFPSFFVHEIVAENMGSCLRRHWPDCIPLVISAGDFNPILCQTSGESSTLRVSSRPEDGDIIARYDYFHGA